MEDANVPGTGAGPAGAVVSLLPAADIPVDPESDQAREWLNEELSRSIYAEAEPGLLERAWKAVADWFGEVFDGLQGLDAGPGTLVLALAAVAAAVVVVLVFRPRFGTAAGKHRELFTEDLIETARGHRTRSERAAAARHWDEALAERFRAMVRFAEERVIFEPRPARTAAEAGAALAEAFPGSVTEIIWLRRRFDEVLYGSSHASSADCRRAAALDAALEQSGPARQGSFEPVAAAPR